MSVCERCKKSFIPIEKDLDSLCFECCDEIIKEHNKKSINDESESNAILLGVMETLKEGSDSNVQQLLERPGVGLALSRLSVVSREEHDIIMFGLNCFRVGAWMAFKQVEVNNLINK